MNGPLMQEQRHEIDLPLSTLSVLSGINIPKLSLFGREAVELRPDEIVALRRAFYKLALLKFAHGAAPIDYRKVSWIKSETERLVKAGVRLPVDVARVGEVADDFGLGVEELRGIQSALKKPLCQKCKTRKGPFVFFWRPDLSGIDVLCGRDGNAPSSRVAQLACSICNSTKLHITGGDLKGPTFAITCRCDNKHEFCISLWEQQGNVMLQTSR